MKEVVMSTMVETESEVRPNGKITPDELLAMPDGGHYELIDGELRERNMGALSNLIAAEVIGILRDHCRQHNLGWLFASDQGYRCFPWKPGRIRRADVTFIRKERYPWDRLSKDGFITIAPDLAVEVVSPNDEVPDLHEKIQEYLRAGVGVVWIINPETRTALILRGDKSANWLEAGDELTGEDIIPGFRCRVGELFPKEAQLAARWETTAEDRGS
jgi:Uma2 family endonuclease